MGRLAGFSYRDVVKRLRKLGFKFYRQCKGSHEIWFNPETRQKVTIPRHSGDIQEGTLKCILKVAGIEVEIFLNVK